MCLYYIFQKQAQGCVRMYSPLYLYNAIPAQLTECTTTLGKSHLQNDFWNIYRIVLRPQLLYQRQVSTGKPYSQLRELFPVLNLKVFTNSVNLQNFNRFFSYTSKFFTFMAKFRISFSFNSKFKLIPKNSTEFRWQF